MIYGIKQIEKQFPGFEARWTGGMVFDVRDIFNLDRGDDLQKLHREIQDKYWDMIKPSNDKMYFVFGTLYKSMPKDYYEVAATIIKNEDALDIGMYINTLRYGVNKSIAINIPYVTVHQHIMEKRTHGAEDKEARKYTFGNTDVISNNAPWSVSKLKTADINTIIDEMLGLFVPPIILSLFYLNVRNIKQITKPISKLRDFYYPKAWGREYKILSLTQTLTDRPTGPHLPPGYHVRGHFQQGHFKRKKTGVYWWNPHWRGDFSKGIVMKDYKVSAL